MSIKCISKLNLNMYVIMMALGQKLVKIVCTSQDNSCGSLTPKCVKFVDARGDPIVTIDVVQGNVSSAM